MTWHISTSEEGRYYGKFATKEDAIAEGIAEGLEVFWVGEARPPKPISEGIFADWVIDQAIDYLEEDYSLDGCEFKSTDDQRKTLQEELRLVVNRWLDQYNLHPKWFLVDNPERIEA